MYEHGQASKRSFHIVNMDPAAEHFKYPVSIGARDYSVPRASFASVQAYNFGHEPMMAMSS